MNDLGSHPHLELKPDCDSVYFGHEEFESLVVMIGGNCEFSFESLRTHIRSCKSSRQAIMCNYLLNYPISIRGYRQKQVRVHRLPNVFLCHCNLGQALGHKMSIYIFFTGVEFIRQTNFLYREEMAVINSALNLTSYYLKLSFPNDESMQSIADQIGRLGSFETKVKGVFSKYIVNRTTHLGPKAMKVFAKYFDEALLSFMEPGGVENCMDPMYNGMRFDDDKCQLKKEYVEKAILALNRGHYFTANLAGFKNCYKERPEFTLRLDRDFYRIQEEVNGGEVPLNEYIQKFVDRSVKKIYRHLRTEVFQIAEGLEEMYYFDIGVEIRCLDDNVDLVTLGSESLFCMQELLELRYVVFLNIYCSMLCYTDPAIIQHWPPFFSIFK